MWIDLTQNYLLSHIYFIQESKKFRSSNLALYTVRIANNLGVNQPVHPVRRLISAQVIRCCLQTWTKLSTESVHNCLSFISDFQAAS